MLVYPAPHHPWGCISTRWAATCRRRGWTGIKVWLVLLFVYGMSGLLSGPGGVMSASRLYSANGNLGVGYELDAIAAVILGGTSFVGGIGTITGTLVGALNYRHPQ